MADVKDILNISSDKTPNRVEAILGKKKTPTQKKRKKPEGLSREVFALQESALLGAGPEVTAPPPQAPVFKEKRVAEPQKVSWVWRGFKSSARTDGAVFKHWIRAEDKVDDYRFARYNRKLKLESYTAAEYNSHLQNPNWTKEETDHLFDLCRRFDLRFVVIADAFEGQKPRTVEELKERFYSVSSKLVDLHKLPDEDLSTNPLHNYTFNRKQEEERKQQGDRLFLRTAAQVQEEEGLIEEFRRIDAEMKKHNKAKKRIAQLMHYALTPNTTDPSTTNNNNNNNNIQAPSPVSLPLHTPKQKKRKAHPNDDDDEYEPESVDFDPNSATQVSTNSATPGRKGRHPNRFQSTPVAMGHKTAYRVESALVELGVLRADAPPVQAPSVTKALNELKQELVILLDLQKYVPMREAHLEVVRQHRDALLQDLKEKGIPIPALHGHDRNALASSSTSVFGLASLEEDGEKEREETTDSFLAPPPSRSRAPRDKEHKRVHKKHKVADV